MSDFPHVRARFARAVDRYDALADVQRQVGAALLAGLPATAVRGRVLDGGCGTGHGLELLSRRWPGIDLVALDFAYPMVARARRRGEQGSRRGAAAGLCADLQALPLADGCLDGLWSNLALQWCDPARFTAEAARVLRPGGWLAVGTLGPGTFVELRQSFATVDRYRHTIPFLEPDALGDICRRAGFSVVTLQRRTRVLHYADLGSLLAAVRELGASRVTGADRRPGLMGRTAWKSFVERYESLRTAEGLPLSYDTVCLHALRIAERMPR
ncbi:malonyl-[acyl-carrier protein] O-methyltransferase BioC [Denitratisoma sp. DHT3]|uniref:malonyl-ACP O-methyltransferase BioC n=1 Tax=Denitratisoma sp. DHT3 TaxID=1981880 RepID=UPI001198CBA2|nr:malonyl-ACP O-methyltransferase BioC [Denitratisoma sp. DHT3]QDX80335.1 malonyl-[acyl-carrier protein] O-methyltransferase BioC [Denitratisoma sp. DHT3]